MHNVSGPPACLIRLIQTHLNVKDPAKASLPYEGAGLRFSSFKYTHFPQVRTVGVPLYVRSLFAVESVGN